MSKRDSFSDPLRPRLNPLDFRPHHEDRVLVKRLPWPKDSGMLWTPGRPKDGPQLGEVVAVGPGECIGGYDVPLELNGELYNGVRWYGPNDGGIAAKKRAPLAVMVGNQVLYARVPPQEFEHEGDLYTYIFEEQHILAVIDG